MITGSIHQEDKTIINVHQSPEYLKQILTSLEGEIDYSTTIVGDLIITFNNGQMIQTKISKKILGLSFTLGQIYFIDIYRKFYPRAAEYTFISMWRLNNMLLKNQWVNEERVNLKIP